MGWTTIRIREDTKQDLKEESQGENMDEKVQFLLGNIETYIQDSIRQELKKIHINERGNIDYR